ncbi:ABC transporter substrate-binding protein [Bradyrhizobium guangzhouense]|uniref:ABC transporter substrate-binding protein n=1 Tax=Bradyrhizobium guangzhouense TaxID=1325095 RepID=A0AAE5X5U1_9BRAD|nr:ABC transporter substrate-binding protein [Bradyrhizobium guangzhouense]QAU49261.1 ABC transporter substrate-binding protein [Bradyrhizobium guangzhouense]RXH15958.1 ABC transporter substrate-binding protein [Bradyrhizobium guangzhouense]
MPASDPEAQLQQSHSPQRTTRSLLTVLLLVNEADQMKRREFIALVGSTFAAWGSQAQDGIRRIGALVTSPLSTGAFEKVLKERGWAVGRNLQIEYRFTGGDTDLTRGYARELLALKPDVLFATTNTSMAALHAEHYNIPTVFAMVSDPVGMHYVESFARPGGNTTGFTPFEPSLGGKWVALLEEVSPNIKHLGIVYNPEPGNNSAAFRDSIEAVANEIGIASIETPNGDASDIDRLIRSFKEKPSSALVFLPDALTSVRRDHIIALVAQSRLPAIYPLRLYCAAGGLMSYGVSINRIYAGAASYVDRILRGASPAELPVQAPTEFELVVNRKAAQQLGLTLPPTLLARVDEVIE